MCAPAAAQGPDACPNGWSPEAVVELAPPVPAVDSGVLNVESPDGCTLLDEIWEGEPFRSHDAFVARVSRVTRAYARAALLRERDRLDVAPGATSTVNTPKVVGHGQVWQSTASDPIEIRPPT